MHGIFLICVCAVDSEFLISSCFYEYASTQIEIQSFRQPLVITNGLIFTKRAYKMATVHRQFSAFYWTKLDWKNWYHPKECKFNIYIYILRFTHNFLHKKNPLKKFWWPITAAKWLSHTCVKRAWKLTRSQSLARSFVKTKFCVNIVR